MTNATILEKFNVFLTGDDRGLTKAHLIVFLVVDLLIQEGSMSIGWKYACDYAKNEVLLDAIDEMTSDILRLSPVEMMGTVITSLKKHGAFNSNGRKGTQFGPRDQRLFKKMLAVMVR